MTTWTQRPSQDEDAQISAAFVRGDSNSLEQVYRRWGSLVFGLARKAVGPIDAEDVTQQVFVSAWQSRPKFQSSQAPLGAWLVGITRHKIADQLRAKPSQAESSIDPTVLAEVLTGAQSSHTFAPERIDLLLTLTAELEKIGDPQRHILVLSFVHDMTLQQISDHLDLPLGTVKSHQARTLRRLRKEMEGLNAHQ